MATQKQIDYIKSLIESRKIENIPMMNEDKTTRAYNNKRRDWLQVWLSINPFSPEGELELNELIERYVSRINALLSVDYLTMANEDASALIEKLKKGVIA